MSKDLKGGKGGDREGDRGKEEEGEQERGREKKGGKKSKEHFQILIENHPILTFKGCQN